jgi:Secretion system C-terminal sorting domain
MTNTNPNLTTNSDGYQGLSATSTAAINASSSAYPTILDIPVLDDDPTLVYDISGQLRTGTKDIGCDEYTTGTTTNRPLAVTDVGPSYLGGPLPITLVSFNVFNKNKTAELNWTTASEQNSSHFEVERSFDGKNFTKIGEVKAAGNSTSSVNYVFKDAFYTEGSHYYRLKQVDLDGKFDYSAIRTVSFDTDKTITIFPNPAKNVIHIQLSTPSVNSFNMAIYNLQGQLVKTINKRETSEIYNISDLNEGVYFAQIIAGSVTKTIKLVIEK